MEYPGSKKFMPVPGAASTVPGCTLTGAVWWTSGMSIACDGASQKPCTTSSGYSPSTAGTTSASGTLSVGFSGTGGGTTKLLAATAAASITGVLQSVIVPQTASGFIHLTTAGQGEVAIATGALTAGVLDVWIYYIVSPL